MRKKNICLVLIDVVSSLSIFILGNRRFLNIAIIALSASLYSIFLTFFLDFRKMKFESEEDRKKIKKVLFRAPLVYLPLILLAILIEFKLLFPGFY